MNIPLITVTVTFKTLVREDDVAAFHVDPLAITSRSTSPAFYLAEIWFADDLMFLYLATVLTPKPLVRVVVIRQVGQSENRVWAHSLGFNTNGSKIMKDPLSLPYHRSLSNCPGYSRCISGPTPNGAIHRHNASKNLSATPNIPSCRQNHSRNI